MSDSPQQPLKTEQIEEYIQELDPVILVQKFKYKKCKLSPSIKAKAYEGNQKKSIYTFFQ